VTDLRDPDILSTIDEMTNAWDQAIAMRALCIAFPFHPGCRDLTERFEELEDAMHLTPDERALLISKAGRIADELRPRRRR
jgi:hypothetical protein